MNLSDQFIMNTETIIANILRNKFELIIRIQRSKLVAYTITLIENRRDS